MLMKRTKPEVPKQSILVRLSYWTFIGLLAYMPLHIFVSTWVGSALGILELTRIAKDIVMFGGFLILLATSFRRSWFRKLAREKLLWLIVGYGVLTLLLALVRPTDLDAEILGVVYNTRFLIFFLYSIMLVQVFGVSRLRRHALIAVFASALVVLSFGIVQYTVLPNSALEHVGYRRSNGVLPAFYIDDKPDLERVMSTLRDPNSYGSYLIIIGSLATALLIVKPKMRRFGAGFVILSLLNLLFSFSRSAWIGFIVSVGVLISLEMKDKINPRLLKKILITGLVMLLLICGLMYSSRNTYFVKNVVFHADESTVLEDPNQLRVRFWKESLRDIASDPVGSGPGTAGLASIRNDTQGTELNENYYLQIASEVGVVGLSLFMGILGVIGLRLLKLYRQDWLVLALLGGFAGLLITNFLVHIWSNETVAYTWWGLSGIALTFNKSFVNR